MPKEICLAVDAMGGDFGPEVNVPGSLAAARETGARIILVGDEASIAAELAKHDHGDVHLEIVHATQVAGMAEKPSDVLRRKKDSSIQVAFRLVRDGQAHGVVTAGNSGAALACGMFILGRVTGVDRPALASILPTLKKPVVLIDVGANADCNPYNLVQFGLMAEVLARYVLDITNPKVGILSIGEEEGKGNALTKEAYALLKNSSLNFIGNVEGRDVYTGDTDVIVCDGFVGNVALKLSEGLGTALATMLKTELNKSVWSRLGTLISWAAFKRFGKKIDYAEYGGAPILGLNGIAIVCHGASSARAITTALNQAAVFVQKRANEQLVQGLRANTELDLFSRSGQSCALKQRTRTAM
ncbi:MAG: phosphate acyltransferase PlsX [Desulfomicrobium sp.]|jgi:glycerol-3-phosphate acyltransferase PlsX|nr:phosphate acyltransferase PlsX [Desulfomicrobium sp.]NLV96268.1 phosphate acyltransferase PlsX [Desulfovibrionales bacterium]